MSVVETERRDEKVGTLRAGEANRVLEGIDPRHAMTVGRKRLFHDGCRRPVRFYEQDAMGHDPLMSGCIERLRHHRTSTRADVAYRDEWQVAYP